MNRKCRLCGKEFELNPIFVIDNMPKSAELVEKNQFEDDNAIDMIVCQCKYCGLVQLDNEVVWYYKESRRASDNSQTIANIRMAEYEKLIEKYSLVGKKVIEIGAGHGEFLQLMEHFDWQTYGIE